MPKPDYTEKLDGPRDVSFFEAIERLVAASRNRLELSDPQRSHVLLISALAVIDGVALRKSMRPAERDEFLWICGCAFDKARGAVP